MNEYVFSVVGAFDRYNYGDMLFPFIIENFIKNSFSNNSIIEYFGIRNFNGEEYRAKSTKSILNIRNNSFIINAGGNTLTAESQFLFLDNINSKLLFNINCAIRKFLGEHRYIRYIRHKTKLNDFPYDFANKRMIYNGVGGDLNSLDISKRERLLSIIEEAGYVSVRDKYSLTSLEDIEAYLVPDSAIVLSDIWSKTFLESKVHDDVKKYAYEPYIAFQISEAFGKRNIDIIIELLSNIHKERGFNIILLPIGVTPSHGDIVALTMIYRALPQFTRIIKKADVFDTTYILSNAKGFIGSSLHGNLISFSYGVESLLITSERSKNYKYYNTWLKNTSVSLALESNLKEVEFSNVGNGSYQYEVERQKKLVQDNFLRIRNYIDNMSSIDKIKE